MPAGRLSVILGARSWAWAIAAGLFGAVLLVLLTRSVIGHPVHYDELLHILAARGLLQSGVPVIADGLYERGELYTRAVAWSFRQFGESPVSARLPALGAGAVLVFLVGAWIVRRSGLLAGAAAAVLLCVVPLTIDVSVFARFYTVHAVVTTLMFISAYEAMRRDSTIVTRALAGVTSVALVPVAWHFQDTTIIVVGSVAVAVAALAIVDYWTKVRALLRQRPLLLIGGVTATLFVGLAAIAYSGLLEQLGKYALWSEHSAGRFQYYMVGFRKDIPLLWPLLPIASVAALARPNHRRLAVFCIAAVLAALAVHSVAAQKTMRYVYYLVPLMCVLWSIALANVMPHQEITGSAAGQSSWWRTSWLAWIILGATFVLSQEGSQTLNLLAGRVANMERLPFAGEPDWTPLVAELVPRAAEADRLVTSNSVKAIYYLGRYDFELNATIVPETESGTEFGRDSRTGGQAIGSADSIRQVLSLPGRTLVVIESSKIGRSSGVSISAFSVIESHCSELALPARAGARAWWCVTPSLRDNMATD
jgi:hypothetical protein